MVTFHQHRNVEKMRRRSTVRLLTFTFRQLATITQHQRLQRHNQTLRKEIDEHKTNIKIFVENNTIKTLTLKNIEEKYETMQQEQNEMLQMHAEKVRELNTVISANLKQHSTIQQDMKHEITNVTRISKIAINNLEKKSNHEKERAVKKFEQEKENIQILMENKMEQERVLHATILKKQNIVLHDQMNQLVNKTNVRVCKKG